MTPKKLILMLRDNLENASSEAIKFLAVLDSQKPIGYTYEADNGDDIVSFDPVNLDTLFDEGMKEVNVRPLIPAFWLEEHHENRAMALENIPLGHVIKSEGVFMIKQVQNYFVRLTGDQAGLMIASSSIGKWEYLGELTNIETKKLDS